MSNYGETTWITVAIVFNGLNMVVGNNDETRQWLKIVSRGKWVIMLMTYSAACWIDHGLNMFFHAGS